MRLLIFLFLLISLPLAFSQIYEKSEILGSEYFKHDESVNGAVISPDGNYFVSGAGKEVIFWDIATLKKVRTIHKLSYEVARMTFSPDGSKILIEDAC